MSRDLETLNDDFKVKATDLLDACVKRGVTMRPFYTERTPWSQARIYRSTRSTDEITRAAERLKANSAEYLAEVLHMVGPQHSPPSGRGHLTNALPGLSWHQWGEAFDCFWLLDGRAAWSTKEEVIVKIEDAGGVTRHSEAKVNGYRVYADEALKAGLLSAGLSWGWDWPHVQLRQHGSPRDVHSWEEIDYEMLAKFGVTEVS